MAQNLMVTESTNDHVMLFDGFDGSLINANFLDLNASTGTPPNLPIEAKVVGSEIWVSDQNADTIFRFDPSGTYLGQSSAALDNVRGFEVAFGSVWVANAAGTYGQALVQLDMNLDFVAAHVGVGSPFDAVEFTLGGVNGMLVSDINDDILWFFDPANPGTPTNFIDSDGVASFDFPEQITFDQSSGSIRVTSLVTPNGFFEFDPVTGVQLDYVDTSTLFGNGGLRAAYELGNGNIMYTNGTGVHIYDPVAGTSTPAITGVQARYINPISGGTTGTAFCDPATNNSTGGPAVLTASTGSGVGANLHLELTGGPSSEFGYFLVGTAAETANPIAISNGFLCLSTTGGNVFGRYNVVGGNLNSIGAFDSGGTFQNLVGTSTVGSGYDVPVNVPITGNPAIMAGDTWHFQAWYRDTPAGAGSSNLSNGLTYTF
ncbi:MAG: hypothetical protein R3E96_14140 [Planctomycetota bacterium]